MSKRNIIIKVEEDSIAKEMGIEAGDELLDINGTPVKDVFDYRYLIQDEYIELGIKKPNGEEWLLEIDKEEFEDLGIVFESGLMDKAKSCSNKCIFCFIDQLPKGMRDSLYFKDDDSRLSFLQGNYVTLTNMRQEDIDRIIFYHLSPINVSVHTTDPDLRKQMLKNPNAVKIMDYLKQLNEHHIEMNFQIVLCSGINDGEQLDKSIEDLSAFMPNAISMSIVPFGMTRYRDGLCQIPLFDKEGAAKVIDQVEAWQAKLLEKYGSRFCFASDEFYITAGRELPPDEFYEGYPQLENGVGMMTLLCDEVHSALKDNSGDSKKRNLTVVTGKASFDFISLLMCDIMEVLSETKIDVRCITNNFFGETITVSGLLTGQDIIAQLKGTELGKYLLLPENCIRTEETKLLDDVDIKDIENEFGVQVVIAPAGGNELLDLIVSLEE
jgi:putative radical SAM enzyme (TIGR03279 family)